MSKTTKWIIAIAGIFIFLFGAVFLITVSWLFSGETNEEESVSSYGQKVAIIELNEPIWGSEKIVRQFKRYRENKAVKAIVFRVDSPGGGVAASQEIYEEVKKTRDSGKPVVVSMGSVAASGGYYVSCGASTIVANPGSVTGSIGVIIQFLNFNELMRKIGLEESTIKTGKFKDSGSPFRKPTEEEKRYLEGLINDSFDQFVSVVASERKLERKSVLKYADGRVFTGRQARKLGLVDTLGTFEDAISLAAQMGKISGKPEIVRERKKRTFWQDLLFESITPLNEVWSRYLNQPFLQFTMTTSF